MEKLTHLIENIKEKLSVITLKPFDTTSEQGRSNERYRKVALSTGSTVIHKLITISSSLISIPLTANYLGAERFGLWMTILSMLSLMAFADLGLGNGLVNEIAKSYVENNKELAKKASSSAFFMLLSIAVIIGILFISTYPFIEWSSIFNVKSQEAINESGPALFVFIISILINLPLSIIQRIQVGYQTGYISNLWAGFGAFLGLTGVIIAIQNELGLPYLVGFMVTGPIIANLINGYYLFRHKIYLFPRLSNIELAISKSLFSLGLVFFLLQFFALISSFIDNIIIAHILGASSVGPYSITKRIFLAVQLSQFIIVPLWPAFIEALARKEYIWAKKTLTKIIRLSIILGTVFTLPLLFFGQEIISYWINDELVPDFSILLGFFFWSFFINYNGAMSVFLNNELLIRKQLKFFGFFAITSVILQIILCPIFGASGVIWGIVTAYAFLYTVPAYRVSFGFLNKKIAETRNTQKKIKRASASI
jgi:O-antigen/teichoic acid export membrane protein